MKHATIQYLIINVIVEYEDNAERVRVNLRNTLEQSSDLHLRKSSSPSSSHDISNEFVQPDPQQFPQAGMHSVLCFLHVHRRVLHSVRQLHLIIGSSFSGAGASAVCCGTNPSSHSYHPHSVGRSPSADPFHSWTCRYPRIL